MTAPRWTDDVELVRAPTPGDPGHVEPGEVRGSLADMIRYITEDVPVWLRSFHSLRLGDGTLINYDEIARLASLDTFREWLGSTPQKH
jgi:hypothetical protein